MDYIKKEFRFDHLNQARIGDSAHFHVYGLQQKENGSFRLELSSRLSTDASGIAACLDLQTNPRLELEEIMKILKTKMSEDTLLTLQ
ncbi:MAG TPA: hypothetical protein VFA41_00240 [Ktedonobacteraceae bacterium]|jgi:hypothetical protein|nr:hypothetical protein [Ktedonobacteraceae bacterium]